MIVDAVAFEEAVYDLHAEALGPGVGTEVFRTNDEVGGFAHGGRILLAHAGAQTAAGDAQDAVAVGVDGFECPFNEVRLTDEVGDEGRGRIFVEFHRRADLSDIVSASF